MSLISFRDKTINAKIVYYGTALSGKTTSLKAVHQAIDPDKRIELVSLNTEGDRTLFFDFLPVPLGTLSGFQVKLQAFTVPGQVKYNLTRRYVLRGADAVAFVADSRPNAFEDNVRSLATLHENLLANSLDPRTIPLVVQYNKRDVPGAASVELLRHSLNPAGVPDFETTATSGEGVFEAFAELCARMTGKLSAEYRLGDPEDARRTMLDRLLEIGRAVGSRRPATGPARVTGTSADLAVGVRGAASSCGAVIEVARDDGDDEKSADVEKLLERAVETNIASARLMAELNETKHRLADHVRQLAALHETGVVIAGELDGDKLLDRILGAALSTVDAKLGSVLLLTPVGDALVEKMVHGFGQDPLARAGPAATRVLNRVLERRPFHLESPGDDDVLVPTSPDDPKPALALVAPLVHQGEVLGALVAYMPDCPIDVDVDMRLRFLGAVAAQAASALENSRLYARVESLNRDLERKVTERTRELEAAYEELKILDKLKDDFLSSMSHELMTPLTSISSFAEILAGIAADEGPSASAERSEFAAIVRRESVRLTEMVQALLDLSRIEAGQVPMTPGSVDLKSAVLASYKRLRPQFKARRIKVKMTADDAMLPARADPRWMDRVFDALLGNAAKFAPEDSEIHVDLDDVGGTARVEIRDRGAGVPEQLRSKIFERFKQLGDVLTDKPPGLGLGLPTARAILERQGGAIWCETGKDGGSVFAFSIPLAAVEATAARGIE